MLAGRLELKVMKILERLTEGLRPITRLTWESLSPDCHTVAVDVSVENSGGRAFVLYLVRKDTYSLELFNIHLATKSQILCGTLACIMTYSEELREWI